MNLEVVCENLNIQGYNNQLLIDFELEDNNALRLLYQIGIKNIIRICPSVSDIINQYDESSIADYIAANYEEFNVYLEEMGYKIIKIDKK